MAFPQILALLAGGGQSFLQARERKQEEQRQIQELLARLGITPQPGMGRQEALAAIAQRQQEEAQRQQGRQALEEEERRARLQATRQDIAKQQFEMERDPLQVEAQRMALKAGAPLDIAQGRTPGLPPALSFLRRGRWSAGVEPTPAEPGLSFEGMGQPKIGTKIVPRGGQGILRRLLDIEPIMSRRPRTTEELQAGIREQEAAGNAREQREALERARVSSANISERQAATAKLSQDARRETLRQKYIKATIDAGGVMPPGGRSLEAIQAGYEIVAKRKLAAQGTTADEKQQLTDMSFAMKLAKEFANSPYANDELDLWMDDMGVPQAIRPLVRAQVLGP